MCKSGDGEAPPTERTVEGLRTTQMSVNGEAVNGTTKESGGWRELLSGAGVRSVSVSAAGIFTGSDAETRLRAQALAGTIDDFQLSYESGERMEGRFLVTRLDYSGAYHRGRPYVLRLESRGPGVSM